MTPAGRWVPTSSAGPSRKEGRPARETDVAIWADPNGVVVIGDSDADIGAAAASVTGMRVALTSPPQSARRTISSKLPVARAVLA